MRHISFSEQDRETIKLRYKTETNRFIKPRLHFLILKDQGFSQKLIAQMLIVTQETISSWLKTYLEKGLDELCKLHFKGSSPKLSPEQIKLFKSEVESHLFQTAKEACAWVKENFDIVYSERAMRDLLKRCGYTRQKAHLIPGKADPEAQSLFFRDLPKDKRGE